MAGKASYRVGVVLTVLPVLFLVFDSVIKFSGLPIVSQSMTEGRGVNTKVRRTRSRLFQIPVLLSSTGV